MADTASHVDVAVLYFSSTPPPGIVVTTTPAKAWPSTGSLKPKSLSAK